MTNEIKNIELKIMKADENMVLTNGTTYSSVGGTVYLSENDSFDNWYEITEEEYNEKMKEIELEATPPEFRNIEMTEDK